MKNSKQAIGNCDMQQLASDHDLYRLRKLDSKAI